MSLVDLSAQSSTLEARGFGSRGKDLGVLLIRSLVHVLLAVVVYVLVLVSEDVYMHMFM